MSCAHIKEQLPGLAYGELPAENKAALEEHLRTCAACREEYAALRRTRELLDAVPAPAVPVDLARLYGAAAERQRRAARRWRRLALATVAAAAAVLVVLGLWNLEVRAEGHQIVLRWGTPPALTPAAAPHIVVGEKATGPEISAADFQLVKELVHMLASDVEARDADIRQALTLIARRVDVLQRLAQQRWDATSMYSRGCTSLNYKRSDP